MQKAQNWPNGKRIAVAVMVLYETWADGKAPSYSVQATSLKSGIPDYASKAWSTYGGRAGIWRIVRMLDGLKVPATFFVNAKCAELYPESIRQIQASNYDIAAHAYTQDQLLSYLTVEEQEQVIKKSLDILESVTGKRPTGWVTPALAFTPETNGLLAQAGVKWHMDVTYTDLPHRIQTGHGAIAGVPTSDFTDNRVLKSSPNDLMDVYKGTFDYLYESEPGSMLVIALHAHFGGRPMIISIFEKIMKYMQSHPDVWWTTHEELAEWAMSQPADDNRYQDRFFTNA